MLHKNQTATGLGKLNSPLTGLLASKFNYFAVNVWHYTEEGKMRQKLKQYEIEMKDKTGVDEISKDVKKQLQEKRLRRRK